jgi:hypothetical protein
MTALTLRDLALLRLRNQRLIASACKTPEEVVGWLGAVQAQDYYGSQWAISQRMKLAAAAVIERAYSAGTILRTHVLRPTWHYVLPADIRAWLSLTAARVRMATRYYDRRLGIDEAELEKSHAVVTAALRGGKHATRAELSRAWEEAGVEAKGQRLGHLLMHAELDALICSGPRRGKQLTYALLDERAPKTKALTREAALAALTKRYFTSHGPALPQDFAWWSGLTITDARAGLAAVGGELEQLTVEGRTYWHAGSVKPPRLSGPVVHMLPNYDEHLIAYKERSAAFDRERVETLGSLLNHLITLDGRLIGGWRRASGALEVTLRTRLNASENKALDAAVADVEQFFAGTPEG